MTDIGVIAIGRNEGERLRLCLRSVVGRGMPVVYVDSGSNDGSRELARSLGAEVVELDLSLPFSAARARNAGFEQLVQLAPDVRYVQFVDGDCEVVDGWIDTARRTLDERTDVAVVCGRRRERFPDASIYNRLADLEWDRPPGEVESCGGDAMYRAAAFRQVNGFDPSVAAGEEPELCQRLRGNGWKVVRFSNEMTLHDSAMTAFAQWWRRQVRSGYGAMDVATRFGDRGLFVRQVRSARAWTVGWGVLLLLLTIVTVTIIPMRVQWVCALVVFTIGVVAIAPLLQAVRLGLRSRKRLGCRDACANGLLTMVGKWGHLLGQARYLRDRAAGRNTRLIEYKSAAASET